jgi:hypothetical protein
MIRDIGIISISPLAGINAHLIRQIHDACVEEAWSRKSNAAVLKKYDRKYFLPSASNDTDEGSEYTSRPKAMDSAFPLFWNSWHYSIFGLDCPSKQETLCVFFFSIITPGHPRRLTLNWPYGCVTLVMRYGLAVRTWNSI